MLSKFTDIDRRLVSVGEVAFFITKRANDEMAATLASAGLNRGDFSKRGGDVLIRKC